MAATALKSKPKRRARVPIPVQVVGNSLDDDEAEQFDNAPLFDVGEKQVASIMVTRTDPDEGTLGACPPSWTEQDIRRRWGGGTFKLMCRDERNKPMKGGFRTIVVAGDPIFESKAAAARWKRSQGLDEPAAAPAGAPGIADVLQLLSAKEASGKTDAEKRLAEMERKHDLELARLRTEAEIRAKERKDEADHREHAQRERDERDKRDREERDARYRREAEDREERRKRDEIAASLRDKEFAVMLAQLNKSKGDGGNPTDMLIRGIELAQKITGDGDPLTELAKNIPGIVDSAKGLLRPGAKVDDDKTLLLEGPLGLKALEVVKHFQRNGVDPAEGLASTFDALLKMGRPAEGAAPAPAAAAVSPAAAPAAAPAAPAEAAPESEAAPAATNGARAASRRRPRPSRATRATA